MGGFVVGSESDDGQDGVPSEASIEDRVSALEDLVDGFQAEICTRRLLIRDDEGQSRVVAEVIGSVTEFRLDLPGALPGERTALLLFAAEGQEDTGAVAGIGAQLWVEGNEVASFAVWRSPEGEWASTPIS